MEEVLKNLRHNKNDIIIDGKIEMQRENLKNVNEKRQELYKIQQEKNNTRIENLHKQNKINNFIRTEAIRKKEEQIKKRLEKVKTLERHKKVQVLKNINFKLKNAQKNLIKNENVRRQKKQNRDTKRYLNKIKHQNENLIEKQSLIDECLEHKISGNDYIEDNYEESLNEYEEEMTDEPLEADQEKCFIDSDRSVSMLT